VGRELRAVPSGAGQCTVCSHPRRDEIDEALVAGVPVRQIQQRYGPHYNSVQRHKTRHLARQLQAVHREKERSESLLERLESLITKLEQLADDAASQGKANQFLATARELRETYRLLGKVTGELDERPQVVNVLISPEWQQVRAVLLTALSPYPEARLAVSTRLLELESGS
jgi:hypothetical protein